MAISSVTYDHSTHTIFIRNIEDTMSKYTYCLCEGRKNFINRICQDYPEMDVMTWDTIYAVVKDWEKKIRGK